MEQSTITLPITPTGEPPAVWLRTILQHNEIRPSDSQVDALVAYTRQLLEWNSKINLVSRKDTDQLWVSHILHCLGIAFLAEFPAKSRVLDLGTGGGLPGVVLGILRPDLQVTCLDATRKKVDAVDAMVKALGLTSISTAWGRAEDLARLPEHEHTYDIVVARAVAGLRDLLRWSKPFLRPRAIPADAYPRKGKVAPPALIALKGGDLGREAAQARALGGVGRLTIAPLVFAGSELIPGVDKQIVIVELA